MGFMISDFLEMSRANILLLQRKKNTFGKVPNIDMNSCRNMYIIYITFLQGSLDRSLCNNMSKYIHIII